MDWLLVASVVALSVTVLVLGWTVTIQSRRTHGPSEGRLPAIGFRNPGTTFKDASGPPDYPLRHTLDPEGDHVKKNQVSRPAGPIQLLHKILKTWRLQESDAALLLGLEPSDKDYAADVLAGRKVLKGRDAKDRLAYLVQMRMTLSAWFQNDAVENDWLREPQDMLDGKVPMELLLEGSMENLLLVKEYVQAAAGW